MIRKIAGGGGGGGGGLNLKFLAEFLIYLTAERFMI